MAILAVVPQAVIGRYPATLPLTANSADIVFTLSGADFADGFTFALTGRELLIFKGGAAPITITINGVKDPYNRVGPITAYSLGIGEFAALGPFPVEGWAQSNGQLTGAASAADLGIAVLRYVD